MDLLDNYNDARKALLDYFGYKDGWTVFPIEDGRGYYWCIDKDRVLYSETEAGLRNESELYVSYAYKDKWIYRAEDYVMLVVDTFTDGNKFLQIFSREKERCVCLYDEI